MYLQEIRFRNITVAWEITYNKESSWIPYFGFLVSFLLNFNHKDRMKQPQSLSSVIKYTSKA